MAASYFAKVKEEEGRRSWHAVPGVIMFYRSADSFGWLSNFYLSPFVLPRCDDDDAELITWPTVEHYFQAAKFFTSDPTHAELILKCKTPTDAKRLGCDRRRKLRADWEDAKNGVMTRAITAKFDQHRTLRQWLIQTGDRVLVEDSKVDSIWGAGRDGHGQNRLGIILMGVRADAVARERRR